MVRIRNSIRIRVRIAVRIAVRIKMVGYSYRAQTDQSVGQMIGY